MSIETHADFPGIVQQQLEQHKKQRQDNFVKNNLMSDEVLDYIQANLMPFNTMMTYYRCAMMEVETKFRVLDAQFSLQYERNPIESIKTRLKSIDSIARKIRRRDLSLWNPLKKILQILQVSGSSALFLQTSICSQTACCSRMI